MEGWWMGYSGGAEVDKEQEWEPVIALMGTERPCGWDRADGNEAGRV